MLLRTIIKIMYENTVNFNRSIVNGRESFAGSKEVNKCRGNNDKNL